MIESNLVEPNASIVRKIIPVRDISAFPRQNVVVAALRSGIAARGCRWIREGSCGKKLHREFRQMTPLWPQTVHNAGSPGQAPANTPTSGRQQH
jgi:hypothetical protein